LPYLAARIVAGAHRTSRSYVLASLRALHLDPQLVASDQAAAEEKGHSRTATHRIPADSCAPQGRQPVGSLPGGGSRPFPANGQSYIVTSMVRRQNPPVFSHLSPSPMVERYLHGPTRGDHKLTVASMVSRREGRAFSDLTSGTGMQQIYHVARIHHNLPSGPLRSSNGRTIPPHTNQARWAHPAPMTGRPPHRSVAPPHASPRHGTLTSFTLAFAVP
jgi:hypothetical protein